MASKFLIRFALLSWLVINSLLYFGRVRMLNMCHEASNSVLLHHVAFTSHLQSNFSKIEAVPKPDEGWNGSSTMVTTPSSEEQTPITSFCGNHKLAFVWYVSQMSGYPCSIIAAIQKLRDLGAPKCISAAVVYNQKRITPNFIAQMNTTNLFDSFHGFDDIPATKAGIGYYFGVLTKLSVFRIPYDRVIFLDADAYPLKPLHELFKLPYGQPDFYAVRPHWLPKQEVCSVLLVLSPDPNVYNRLKEKYFKNGTSENGMYDMDILGAEFDKDHRTGLLPGSILELETVVQKKGDDVIRNTSLVHFSENKPWWNRKFKSTRLNEIHADWKRRVQPFCENFQKIKVSESTDKPRPN